MKQRWEIQERLKEAFFPHSALPVYGIHLQKGVAKATNKDGFQLTSMNLPISGPVCYSQEQRQPVFVPLAGATQMGHCC